MVTSPIHRINELEWLSGGILGQGCCGLLTWEEKKLMN